MNVLLVRPDGIEDEMLCLPVASAMHRLLPDARITFLSSEYAAPLLAHHLSLPHLLRPCLGKGASLGEEAVLADSGRAGEKYGLFEHPAWSCLVVPDMRDIRFQAG
jgi:hypothetical protein